MLPRATAYILTAQDLLEILVTRSLKTGNEVIRMALTPAKAVAARDGFAQLAYSCLFSWLIARVNESLQPTQATQVRQSLHSKDEVEEVANSSDSPLAFWVVQTIQKGPPKCFLTLVVNLACSAGRKECRGYFGHCGF